MLVHLHSGFVLVLRLFLEVLCQVGRLLHVAVDHVQLFLLAHQLVPVVLQHLLVGKSPSVTKFAVLFVALLSLDL